MANGSLRFKNVNGGSVAVDLTDAASTDSTDTDTPKDCETAMIEHLTNFWKFFLRGLIVLHSAAQVMMMASIFGDIIGENLSLMWLSPMFLFVAVPDLLGILGGAFAHATLLQYHAATGLVQCATVAFDHLFFYQTKEPPTNIFPTRIHLVLIKAFFYLVALHYWSRLEVTKKKDKASEKEAEASKKQAETSQKNGRYSLVPTSGDQVEMQQLIPAVENLDDNQKQIEAAKPTPQLIPGPSSQKEPTNSTTIAVMPDADPKPQPNQGQEPKKGTKSTPNLVPDANSSLQPNPGPSSSQNRTNPTPNLVPDANSSPQLNPRLSSPIGTNSTLYRVSEPEPTPQPNPGPSSQDQLTKPNRNPVLQIAENPDQEGYLSSEEEFRPPYQPVEYGPPEDYPNTVIEVLDRAYRDADIPETTKKPQTTFSNPRTSNSGKNKPPKNTSQYNLNNQ